MPRIIMHVDMDAFYASVEQRDHPELQGKPVVVGGSSSDRGVVAAASYEAREFGIRSAMPMHKALRLCPQAVRRPVRMAAYKEVSLQIHALLQERTRIIEPISLDEAYLDLSEQVCDFNHAEAVARTLKRSILEETRLTASVGIGPNKFLAKISSDYKKPNGLFVVHPEDVQSFLDPLPVRKIPGVGKKTDERLMMMDVRTIEQLRTRPMEELCDWLGTRTGERLHRLSHGVDETKVESLRHRKSLSQERTFSQDISSPEAMKIILTELAEDVSDMLKSKALQGRTIGIKVRYSDFRTATRSFTLDERTDDAKEIARIVQLLLDRVALQQRSVRLLGVRIAGFDPGTTPDSESGKAVMQMKLF